MHSISSSSHPLDELCVILPLLYFRMKQMMQIAMVSLK